jgi:hypothetical protein
MKIFDVIVQNMRTPNDNVITKRLWADTAQEAVDKVRASGVVDEANGIKVVSVAQIINCKDWK